MIKDRIVVVDILCDDVVLFYLNLKWLILNKHYKNEVYINQNIQFKFASTYFKYFRTFKWFFFCIL